MPCGYDWDWSRVPIACLLELGEAEVAVEGSADTRRAGGLADYMIRYYEAALLETACWCSMRVEKRERQ